MNRTGLFGGCTLPETNSSHLKMDGWKTILSFWGPAYFQGRTVSFREGIFCLQRKRLAPAWNILHWKGFLMEISFGTKRWNPNPSNMIENGGLEGLFLPFWDAPISSPNVSSVGDWTPHRQRVFPYRPLFNCEAKWEKSCWSLFEIREISRRFREVCDFLVKCARLNQNSEASCDALFMWCL